MGQGFKEMTASAIAVVGLSASVLVGLAIVDGFADTGLVNNTTAQRFVTGLGIYGSFVGVIVLALIGKIILGLFKKGSD